jgi:hypothetical protein
MTAVSRWTSSDLRAFQEATGLTNERFAQRLRVSTRTVANWRAWPDPTLPDLAQRTLPEALAHSSDEVRQRFEAMRESEPPSADTVDAVMATTADEIESDELALAREPDPTSIAALWHETVSLARAHHHGAFDVFKAARRVRHRARDTVTHTRRPAVLADLYVIISRATALMGSAAFDLHRWYESDALAQSAVTYARLAGHRSLQAWALGLRATLANWRNEPELALTYYQQATALAPHGAPRFRLHHIESRSHALLVDAGSAARALARAQREREAMHHHHDDLHDECGGEFTFTDARAAACAAATWLDLGNGPGAAAAAQAALVHLAAMPAARQPFSQLNGARIDLATAHLRTHDLPSAADAVRPVLDLPHSMRNVSLTGRLERVRAALTAAPWTANHRARSLRRDVETWLSEAAPLRGELTP